MIQSIRSGCARITLALQRGIVKPNGAARGVIMLADTATTVFKSSRKKACLQQMLRFRSLLVPRPAGYYGVVVSSGRSNALDTIELRIRVTFFGLLEDLVDSSVVRSR